MKISIIVPVYKVEKYIRKCIESVLSQTYTDWEMILVDDGSPDKSGEICDEYARQENRIKVIHKENGGLSSARNAGLDLPPQGEYVTFLDSDDFWHPEYLSVMVKMCLEYDAEIAMCSVMRGKDTNYPQSFKLQHDTKSYEMHNAFVSGVVDIIMCAKLFKKSLFDGIRMPVGFINEDDWTTWKLFFKSNKIAITTDALYYYTVNDTSIMANAKKKPDLRYFGAYEERIAFFRDKGMEDLEHCSRLQFCKSLLLTYSNPLLDEKQKKLIRKHFTNNWSVIKHSPYVGLKYKLLFSIFKCAPLSVSSLIKSARRVLSD